MKPPPITFLSINLFSRLENMFPIIGRLILNKINFAKKLPLRIPSPKYES